MSESREMDDLQAAVEEATTVSDSAIALINGFAAKVEEAAGDRAASTALAQSMRSKAAELSAAVTANTPAADGNA